MSHKEKEILQWATDRQIIGPSAKATPLSQHGKTEEEVQELGDAIAVNDIPEIIDAIGDIYVTLVIQANLNGLTMNQCIDAAYDQIKNRAGKMVGGVFVKDGKS